MAKMDYDTILRCANTNCYHNRDGYNCTCAVIALNNEGRCALYKPKPVPKDTAVAQNNPKIAFDMETSK